MYGGTMRTKIPRGQNIRRSLGCEPSTRIANGAPRHSATNALTRADSTELPSGPAKPRSEMVKSPAFAPAPIVGLGLIILWNRNWSAFIYQGLTIVFLAWFARFLPVAVFLTQGALARVPRELESAAALAGSSAVKRFVSVVLPNAAPGLAAAWIATYVLSATEFAATLLIAPPGSPLLAPSVVNLMRRGQ